MLAAQCGKHSCFISFALQATSRDLLQCCRVSRLEVFIWISVRGYIISSLPPPALHWWNHQQISGLLCGRQSRGCGPRPSIRQQDRADCGQRQWAQKLSGRVKSKYIFQSVLNKSVCAKELFLLSNSYVFCLCSRCYMLMAVLLASTAPFRMASAMNSCRETP